jgi:hypothetical protein
MYETVTAEEGPFIKVMNVGERIEVNRIEGGSSFQLACGPDLSEADHQDIYKRDAVSSS